MLRKIVSIRMFSLPWEDPPCQKVNNNKPRILTFCNKNKHTKANSLLEKIKSINQSRLIQRSNYVASIWTNGTSSNPAGNMEESKYGLREENGLLVINWFEGEQIPNEDGTLESEKDEESEGDCEDDISDTSDFEDNYDCLALTVKYITVFFACFV